MRGYVRSHAFTAGLVALVVVLLGLLLYSGGPLSVDRYPEAKSIGGARDFQELSARFQELADTKGAEYAYEILRRAKLPPGTDLHLLGHVVGDKLYEEVGVDGVALCTQEFRNACSHSIVIGALNEYGDQQALPLVKAACEKAPGGSGAYTMCYHGLGHGVFSYYGYEYGPTLDFCKETGTSEHRSREYIECMGGTVMELMGGASHDPEGLTRAQEKYFSKTDPLSPCDTSVFPDDVKGICYTYLTPHLFEAAGGHLANPTPDDFEQAFTFCDRIPKERTEDRKACFGGIGKEFPVLALSRDIRSLDKAPDSALEQMHGWCLLAPHQEAYEACNFSLLESLYWGGENDPEIVIRYCATIDDAEERDKCFGYFTGAIGHYVEDTNYRERVCGAFPKEYASSCREALL